MEVNKLLRLLVLNTILLSIKGNVYDTIKNGLDVAGEINGEEATGSGQILIGNIGNLNTEGLAIRYRGHSLPGDSHSSNIAAESYLEQTQVSEMHRGERNRLPQMSEAELAECMYRRSSWYSDCEPKLFGFPNWLKYRANNFTCLA